MALLIIFSVYRQIVIQPRINHQTILWRVCVVDGWFTASPGLSQTDWTLAGWGCTPGVHEQSWHPRINQPSTHTLEEEPQS